MRRFSICTDYLFATFTKVPYLTLPQLAWLHALWQGTAPRHTSEIRNLSSWLKAHERQAKAALLQIDRHFSRHGRFPLLKHRAQQGYQFPFPSCPIGSWSSGVATASWAAAKDTLRSHSELVRLSVPPVLRPGMVCPLKMWVPRIDYDDDTDEYSWKCLYEEPKYQKNVVRFFSLAPHGDPFLDHTPFRHSLRLANVYLSLLLAGERPAPVLEAWRLEQVGFLGEGDPPAGYIERVGIVEQPAGRIQIMVATESLLAAPVPPLAGGASTPRLEIWI